MKAIYKNELCVVTKDGMNGGVEMIPVTSTDERDIFFVDYGDPDLIIDPTDDEVALTKS